MIKSELFSFKLLYTCIWNNHVENLLKRLHTSGANLPPHPGKVQLLHPWKAFCVKFPTPRAGFDSQMPVGCTKITWQKHHQEYWTIDTIRWLIYVSWLIQLSISHYTKKTTIAWWIVQYHNYAILCPHHYTTIFQKYEAISMAFLMC